MGGVSRRAGGRAGVADVPRYSTTSMLYDIVLYDNVIVLFDIV